MPWGILSQVILPNSCVFILCCWYQRAWSARSISWAQYEVFGFLVPLPFPDRKGIAHHCMPVGDGLANCAGVTAACLGFLDPLCGITPQSSFY